MGESENIAFRRFMHVMAYRHSRKPEAGTMIILAEPRDVRQCMHVSHVNEREQTKKSG